MADEPFRSQIRCHDSGGISAINPSSKFCFNVFGDEKINVPLETSFKHISRSLEIIWKIKQVILNWTNNELTFYILAL